MDGWQVPHSWPLLCFAPSSLLASCLWLSRLSQQLLIFLTLPFFFSNLILFKFSVFCFLFFSFLLPFPLASFYHFSTDFSALRAKETGSVLCPRWPKVGPRSQCFLPVRGAGPPKLLQRATHCSLQSTLTGHRPKIYEATVAFLSWD